MKYFPLIWAALRRKPIRTGVTFLSVTVAFTLFGLMIGLNATMDMMQQRARADRIWTLARFETTGLPVTMARRIAELPGIKKNSVMTYLPGYVGDPKNRAFVLFIDDEYGNIFPDQVPPQQADLLRYDRTAVVMNVGVMAIAAVIGAGGLGMLLLDGISGSDIRMLIAGALMICLLAIVLDWLLHRLQLALTPKGIR